MSLEEGLYQLEILNERLVVDIKMSMIAQWPSKHEEQMAFFLSGPPRFPYRVLDLKEMGGRFIKL